jgi:hypothetical protein
MYNKDREARVSKTKKLKRDAPHHHDKWHPFNGDLSLRVGLHLNRIGGVAYRGQIELYLGCVHVFSSPRTSATVKQSFFAEDGSLHTYRYFSNSREEAAYIQESLRFEEGPVVFDVTLNFVDPFCTQCSDQHGHANMLIVHPPTAGGDRVAMLYDPHGAESDPAGGVALERHLRNWRVPITHFVTAAAQSTFAFQDILNKGCCMDLAGIVVHCWLLMRRSNPSATLQDAEELLVDRDNLPAFLMQYRALMKVKVDPDAFIGFFHGRGHRWTCTCSGEGHPHRKRKTNDDVLPPPKRARRV